MGFNVNYSIGNACNLRCGFCYNDNDRNKKQFFKDILIIKKELIYLYEKGIGITFIGGEPTFHPNFIEILKIAKEIGYINIILITNGIKFSDFNFTKKILDLGILNGIVFSIHSISNTLEDKITGRKNTFSKKNNGIENILMFKKENNIELSIYINFVVNIMNINYINSVVIYFLSKKIDEFRFYFMLLFNDSSSKNIELFPKYSDIIKNINYINKKYYNKISFHWAPLCISKQLKGGNIREINKKYLYNINSKKKKLLDNHIDNKIKLEECSKCFAYGKFCFGVYINYINKYGRKEFKAISKEDLYKIIKNNK